MKKTVLATVAAALAAAAHGRIVSMPKAGIEMDIPDSLVALKSSNLPPGAYYYIDNETRANVNVVVQAKERSMEEFKKLSLEQYGKLNAKVKKAEIDTETGALDLEVELDLGRPCTCYQRVVEVNGKFAIATATAFEAKDKKAMRRVVSTVRAKTAKKKTARKKTAPKIQ